MRASLYVLSGLLGGIGFLALAAPGRFAAQVATPAAASAPARRITLDVVVTDHSGNPVRGLQQQDFTLLDDKQPQTIVAFRVADGSNQAEDPPVDAILVLDRINPTFQTVSSEEQQLKGYLQAGAGGELPLPTSLLFLSDTEGNRTPSTRDGKALMDSLNSSAYGLRAIRRTQGFNGGVDRANRSLGALQQIVSSEVNQPGRKLVVWLGPAWPILTGPNVRLSNKDRNALFQAIVSVSTALRETRMTLYNVSFPGTLSGNFYYETFLKGVSSANSVQNGNLSLQVLAVQSGGLVLNRSNDLAASITTCQADAKVYYTLAFDPPPAKHSDEYHNLQVKIGRPGLTVRTRTGYYAQP